MTELMVSQLEERLRISRESGSAVAISLWAVAIALAPSLVLKGILLSAVLGCVLLWWIAGNSDRWVICFFAAAILLPPLPLALGDSGPHIAPLFAVIGLGFTIARLPARIPQARFVLLVFLFVCSLLISDAFAAFYSSPQVALLTLFRIFLFAIGPLLLFHALSDPISSGRALRFSRFLFRLAVIAALFACIDFKFQLPSPSGFGPQFVWLENEVLRRAQGLFYEASTLGNFCAFFLVFALVSFFSPRDVRPCSRAELALGSTVLATALVLSYSRASLLCLVCAITAFFVMRRQNFKRLLFSVILPPLVAALLLNATFPAFWHTYWIRLQTSVQYFGSAPEAVLSGRLGEWTTLVQFARDNPGHLLFGIGYKTLPYSHYIGQAVIADNTYLDLLIETGIFGLLTFLALNFEMLRLSARACRLSTVRGMFARLFFCFWIGELVQMFSGDLITYWRVLPIYFWVLGVGVSGMAEGNGFATNLVGAIASRRSNASLLH